MQDGISQDFYSWECISLYFQHRTLDLVIKDQNQLFALIGYLQNHNASPIVRARKIWSFKLMRVKMKISYQALLKGQTIVELFLNVMLKTIS